MSDAKPMGYFKALSSLNFWNGVQPPLPVLAEALETSWDHLTAYQGLFDPENPAFGQCYPTSRVVQWFYPDYEIASGEVWTGSTIERHFWNVRNGSGGADRIDLSWKQFPSASVIQRFEILRTGASDDSQGTQERCALLLRRVLTRLGQK